MKRRIVEGTASGEDDPKQRFMVEVNKFFDIRERKWVVVGNAEQVIRKIE